MHTTPHNFAVESLRLYPHYYTDATILDTVSTPLLHYSSHCPQNSTPLQHATRVLKTLHTAHRILETLPSTTHYYTETVPLCCTTPHIVLESSYSLDSAVKSSRLHPSNTHYSLRLCPSATTLLHGFCNPWDCTPSATLLLMLSSKLIPLYNMRFYNRVLKTQPLYQILYDTLDSAPLPHTTPESHHKLPS